MFNLNFRFKLIIIERLCDKTFGPKFHHFHRAFVAGHTVGSDDDDRRRAGEGNDALEQILAVLDPRHAVVFKRNREVEESEVELQIMQFGERLFLAGCFVGFVPERFDALFYLGADIQVIVDDEDTCFAHKV